MKDLIDPDIFEDLKIAVDNKNIDSIIDNFNKIGYNTSRANFKYELERKRSGGELAEYCNLILYVIQERKLKTKID